MKQWKKWSGTAKEVFSDVYSFVFFNQDVMTHPKAVKITPKHWKTLAWNTAWIAADAVDGTIPDIIIDV